MGQKRRSRECSSPTKTSAPAPSSFIFPLRRSHCPRIPFGGAHEDFGLPQQQLSTMGYPRKSYPHRCSPPCAKRARPRACARVYIIYRSPVGRSRECPRRCGHVARAAVRRVGEGEGKGGRPLAQCPALSLPTPRTCPPKTEPPPAYGRSAERRVGKGEGKGGRPLAQQPALSPLMSESLCAKAECTRQSPLLPVRSPRVSLSTAAPLPADGRSAVRSPRVSPPTAEPPSADGRSAVCSPRDSPPTAAPPPADGRSAERRVGKGEGKGGRPLAQQPALSPPTVEPLSAYRPASARLPPRPRRLNGSPASAGGRENDRMAHRRTATPTHRTPRGNDTCTIRVPRRKGAQSVVHNL